MHRFEHYFIVPVAYSLQTHKAHFGDELYMQSIVGVVYYYYYNIIMLLLLLLLLLLLHTSPHSCC